MSLLPIKLLFDLMMGIKRYAIVFCSLLFTCLSLEASHITEILPLTQNIVMRHFTNECAIYNKIGQAESNECGLDPTRIGRKNKGVGFTSLCQRRKNTPGCSSSDPDYVKEHWVCLFLPTPMKLGKTYTINTKSLAGKKILWNITFDKTKKLSEAIHVNQIDYVPSATICDVFVLRMSSFVQPKFIWQLEMLVKL